MKLYYSPGACSLSPHIVLREAGLDFELERVDVATKRTESGADFLAVNPKGYVPALRLGDGQVLTEGAAIVQFLADQRPESGLAPAAGTLDRARLHEHLTFIASELHKAFGPLFSPSTTEEGKEAARANVRRRLGHIESILSDGRPHLLGERFSAADAYLFAIASWTAKTGVALADFPNVAAFMDRVSRRETVQAAMRAEGLLAA